MFEIEIDAPDNIVTVHFTGYFSAAEAGKLLRRFEMEIACLKPGFILVSDLSQLLSMETDAHKGIDNIMELSNQKGISRVIRVIVNKDIDIGFNIMSLFHYSHSVIIQTCSSMEEARMVLKSIVKKGQVNNGIT